MEPVVVRINRRRCFVLGALQAAVGLSGFAALAVPIWHGIYDWVILAGLGGSAMFLWFAAFFFGLARRNPVALRMDEGGISGYYVTPAGWDDIASVKAFAGYKRQRFLGFALKDPAAFHDQQSPWRRYVSHSNSRQHGTHLVVPQIVLSDHKVDALAEFAQAFLSQSAGKD